MQTANICREIVSTATQRQVIMYSLLLRVSSTRAFSSVTPAVTAAAAATTTQCISLSPRSRLNRLGTAMVVLKQSRWEHESERYQLTGDELQTELQSRGYPVDRIRASHDRHRTSVETMLSEFVKHNVKTTVVPAGKMRAWLATGRVPSVDEHDALFTAGGDGTVLQAALSVCNSDMPVVTVNTDPCFSAGKLCCLELHEDRPDVFGKALELLKRNKFEWLMRKRLAVSTVVPQGNNNKNTNMSKTMPSYPLNEIFYSERDASRPSVHDTCIQAVDRTTSEESDFASDGIRSGETYRQRSSGVIVCTGTGSTAWMSSASHVPPVDVQRILSEISKQCSSSQILTNAQMNLVANHVSTDCVFSGEANFIEYCVREPVLNGWTDTSDQEAGGIAKAAPRRGFAREVVLTAKGWEPRLTLDGLIRVPVPFGTKVHVTVAPESASLRTLRFSPDDF